jgi:hypothetical protein
MRWQELKALLRIFNPKANSRGFLISDVSQRHREMQILAVSDGLHIDFARNLRKTANRINDLLGLALIKMKTVGDRA